VKDRIGGQRDLDDHDRQLGGDEHRRRRAVVGRAAPQRRDPHAEPEVAVELVAEVADARGAIQPPPIDAPARRADAHVPRLAARDQPDDLQPDPPREHGRRCRAERVDEVLALLP